MNGEQRKHHVPAETVGHAITYGVACGTEQQWTENGVSGHTYSLEGRHVAIVTNGNEDAEAALRYIRDPNRRHARQYWVAFLIELDHCARYGERWSSARFAQRLGLVSTKERSGATKRLHREFVRPAFALLRCDWNLQASVGGTPEEFHIGALIKFDEVTPQGLPVTLRWNPKAERVLYGEYNNHAARVPASWLAIPKGHKSKVIRASDGWLVATAMIAGCRLHHKRNGSVVVDSSLKQSGVTVASRHRNMLADYAVQLGADAALWKVGDTHGANRRVWAVVDLANDTEVNGNVTQLGPVKQAEPAHKGYRRRRRRAS